jgi:carbonic anhydrase
MTKQSKHLLTMKKTLFACCIIYVAMSCLSSCKNSTASKDETTTANDSVITATIKPLRERVLTAEEQRALTPEIVLQRLKEGNQRYVSNDLTARDHSAMVRNASSGQYPKAVILSCLDSRVPVEDVFDKGIGDIFVGRVAGNIVNEDLLGSLEFGCKVSGAKLILVLGHESCGAIKAAIDDVQMANITAMLAKIKPAVIKSQNFDGEKSSKNNEYVDYVGKNNVLNTIETIRAKSPVLKEMEDKGEIKIAGAYYNLKTGEVIFL